jgi:hypothetical protein
LGIRELRIGDSEVLGPIVSMDPTGREIEVGREGGRGIDEGVMEGRLEVGVMRK